MIHLNECKPITPLTGTQIPECPAGQECRLNPFGDFGDFGCSANAQAVQDIEVAQSDSDRETTTTTSTPLLTPVNPMLSQDQSKASLCPREQGDNSQSDVWADNTATALNFGDFGGSANAQAVQDID
jgi:hypothetical protein